MFRFIAKPFAAPQTTRTPGLKARLAVEGMEDRLTPSASTGAVTAPVALSSGATAAATHGFIIIGGMQALGDVSTTKPSGHFPVFFADGHV